MGHSAATRATAHGHRRGRGAYQLLQQCGAKGEAERPHRLAPGGQVGQDPSRKVADLHLGAVQQAADVVQEALHHQLRVQLPHLRDVVLNHSAKAGLTQAAG